MNKRKPQLMRFVVWVGSMWLGVLIGSLVITSLSFGIILFITFFPVFADYASPIYWFSGAVLPPLCFGGAIGSVQWLLLKQEIHITKLWIVVTLLGFLLSNVIVELVMPQITEVIRSGLSALIIGTVQWLLLRRQVARAIWWIFATVMANLFASLILQITLSVRLSQFGVAFFSWFGDIGALFIVNTILGSGYGIMLGVFTGMFYAYMVTGKDANASFERVD